MESFSHDYSIVLYVVQPGSSKNHETIMPTQTISPTILAKTTVQHDFPTVLSEIYTGLVPSERIWLSCYKLDEPSVHGRVAAALNERDRTRVVLRGEDGVQLERVSDTKYTASCDALGISHTEIVVPSETYADPAHADYRHPHQIPTFALLPQPPFSSSSSSRVLATGHTDGSVSLYVLPPTPPSPSAPYALPTSHGLTPYATGKLHLG
ncbi:hypothetical protein EW146_g8110 [Bondarzewia mesenterica]|uniref:Uncharacterized protein n=1 Tax=Bondarzewia mesenterica TaxID=1095465 RepID=A0A4S4LH16_9AGAM|nr:hypothetical protein EW146_g8110 [Bondarzewia mesenterica]